MIDKNEIKNKAKKFAFSHKADIWKPVLVFMSIDIIIFGLYNYFMNYFNISSESFTYNIIYLIISIIFIPIQFGVLDNIVNTIKGNKSSIKKDILDKYNVNKMWKIIMVSLVSNLIISFMSILLIVPGIIYSLKYSMIFYLMIDCNKNEFNETNFLKKSDELIEGYKMDYFGFILSFIGWLILGMLSFGILYIWILPYMTTAQYYYFEELKNIKSKDIKN